MTDATAGSAEAPKKGSKLPLILGLVLAIVGGGAGFYVMYSGMLGGGESKEVVKPEAALDALPDISFVALDPIIVSTAASQGTRHLRFRAQLEVPSAYQDEVTSITPRVIDVLNSYLRAIEFKDFEDPTALVRLRSQMLRRVQVVTGEGRVRDLLIMEFVLN